MSRQISDQHSHCKLALHSWYGNGIRPWNISINKKKKKNTSCIKNIATTIGKLKLWDFKITPMWVSLLSQKNMLNSDKWCGQTKKKRIKEHMHQIIRHWKGQRLQSNIWQRWHIFTPLQLHDSTHHYWVQVNVVEFSSPPFLHPKSL